MLWQKIVEVKESFISNVLRSNFYTANMYLENDLVSIDIINEALIELLSNPDSCKEMVELLITNGAIIPPDINVIIGLPDELFLIEVEKITYVASMPLMENTIEFYDKMKWLKITSEINFPDMNFEDYTKLLYVAKDCGNYEVFIVLLEHKRDDPQLIFYILLQIIERSKYLELKSIYYLLSEFEWSNSQLLLCNLLKDEMETIIQKFYPKYTKTKMEIDVDFLKKRLVNNEYDGVVIEELLEQISIAKN